MHANSDILCDWWDNQGLGIIKIQSFMRWKFHHSAPKMEWVTKLSKQSTATRDINGKGRRNDSFSRRWVYRFYHTHQPICVCTVCTIYVHSAALRTAHDGDSLLGRRDALYNSCMGIHWPGGLPTRIAEYYEHTKQLQINQLDAPNRIKSNQIHTFILDKWSIDQTEWEQVKIKSHYRVVCSFQRNSLRWTAFVPHWHSWTGLVCFRR